MTQVRTAFYATEGGWVGVGATNKGLVAMNLPVPTLEEAKERVKSLLPAGCTECTELSGGPFDEWSLTRVGDDLQEYFRGRPVEFNCPIDWEGCAYTPFQEKALRACHQVGYGQAVTYGDIARAAGSPGASRAVGHAMHINRVALVVP